VVGIIGKKMVADKIYFIKDIIPVTAPTTGSIKFGNGFIA
jgi:hypothetical protein